MPQRAPRTASATVGKDSINSTTNPQPGSWRQDQGPLRFVRSPQPRAKTLVIPILTDTRALCPDKSATRLVWECTAPAVAAQQRLSVPRTRCGALRESAVSASRQSSRLAGRLAFTAPLPLISSARLAASAGLAGAAAHRSACGPALQVLPARPRALTCTCCSWCDLHPSTVSGPRARLPCGSH